MLHEHKHEVYERNKHEQIIQSDSQFGKYGLEKIIDRKLFVEQDGPL